MRELVRERRAMEAVMLEDAYMKMENDR